MTPAGLSPPPPFAFSAGSPPSFLHRTKSHTVPCQHTHTPMHNTHTHSGGVYLLHTSYQWTLKIQKIILMKYPTELVCLTAICLSHCGAILSPPQATLFTTRTHTLHPLIALLSVRVYECVYFCLQHHEATFIIQNCKRVSIYSVFSIDVVCVCVFPSCQHSRHCGSWDSSVFWLFAGLHRTIVLYSWNCHIRQSVWWLRGPCSSSPVKQKESFHTSSGVRVVVCCICL